MTSGGATPVVADRPRDRAAVSEAPQAHSSAIRHGPNNVCVQGTTVSFGNSSIYGGAYQDPTP
ncbi:MAG: hypothetical protein H0U28_00015 [Nocardioidaceae bacterium]|nr:hypothetical protein [Nocardioidaceae bacterium]